MYGIHKDVAFYVPTIMSVQKQYPSLSLSLSLSLSPTLSISLRFYPNLCTFQDRRKTWDYDFLEACGLLDIVLKSFSTRRD